MNRSEGRPAESGTLATLGGVAPPERATPPSDTPALKADESG